MKFPIIEELNLPELVNVVSGLPLRGKLAKSPNNLVYLDISDDYIHRSYPLLIDKNIKKPNYFGTGMVGAHISVIYPEENILINCEDLTKEHDFEIQGAFATKIGFKKYYALAIHAPSLLLLRRRYGLPDMLPFKGYLIGFHITIGAWPLDQ